MTDLIPVLTPTASPDFGPGTAVIVTRDERTVRLGDCDVAPENLRHGEPPDDDIPGLAAALKAAGQLQPLTVRAGRRKESAWMALDGRRRLLALALLLKAGEIDADYPVKVYVETDKARQAAAVLLTNTAVPVHVADVIAAIGRLLKARLTVTAIARALGYAEIEIKRLAALSALPPDALVALKAGKLTLKQARLLARLPDKVEQAEIAETVLEGFGFQDWRITERLKSEQVTIQDRRGARAEATELAALCDADITLYWTPDAPFLQPHSKGLLTGMLADMGSDDPRSAALKKTELVDWVDEQAAEHNWAPAFLSWKAEPEDEAHADDDDGDGARTPDSEPDGDGAEGAGAFEVTPAGEAALEQAAA